MPAPRFLHFPVEESSGRLRQRSAFVLARLLLLLPLLSHRCISLVLFLQFLLDEIGDTDTLGHCYLGQCSHSNSI